MSLKCRIFRDEEGQIDFVNAPNGNRSKLFDNLVNITGGNKNTALNIYALTEVEELKESMNTKLNALKERFKNIVKVAPSDVRFSIIGLQGAQNLDAISGDTAIVDNLEVAIEMEIRNESPLKIKIATGWQRGADNQWKYELDSSKASLNFNLDSMNKLGKKYSLKSILKYPELFKAYPELNDVKISVSKKGGKTEEGYFDGNEIVLGILEKDFKEFLEDKAKGRTSVYSQYEKLNELLLPVTLHEVQHWIQKKEGFAKGSNTLGIYFFLTDKQKEEYKSLSDKWKKIKEELDRKGLKWYDADAPKGTAEAMFAPGDYLMKKYRSAMGEEEARNVEKRLKMTPKERLYSLLQDTEDAPRGEQIFIPQNRTSYNTISEAERSAYEAEIKRKEGFALSQNTDWARDEWFKMLVYSDNKTIMKMTETAKPALLIKLAEQYGLTLKDGNQRLAAMSAVRKEAVRQNKELFGRANDEQVISNVIDRLKESGLAKNVYQMSNSEIEAKLVELGVSPELAKQVVAYHGSPHSFDSFTTEKMGTGEGAQAFGWGLYFTDLESIARSYAENLGNIEAKVYVNGKEIGYGHPLFDYQQFILRSNGNVQAVLNELKDIQQAESGFPANARTKARQKAIAFLEKTPKIKIEASKNLYKVSLHKGKTPIASDNFSVLGNLIIPKKNPNMSQEEYAGKARRGEIKPLKEFNTKEEAEQWLREEDKKAEYTWLEWDRDVPKKQLDEISKNVLDKTLVINTTGIFQFQKNGKFYRGEKTNNEWKFIDRNTGESVSYSEVSNAWQELYNEEVLDKKEFKFYKRLEDFLESDKNASLFLLESGIDGIKYPAESTVRGTTSDTARGFNYVVFDENAITIEEQVQFSKKGIDLNTAGFTYQGDVYLNTDVMGLDTPIHEFGHLHLDWLKENRNDLYKAGLSLIKKNKDEAKQYIDIVKQTQPDLKEGTEKFNNEVLAQVIGDQGARLVNSKKDNSIADWLNNVWEAIKDILGLSNYTAEEVANMTLAEFGRSSAAEMLSGRDIKGGSSFFTSGVNFSKIYKKPVFEGNSDIDRIKGLEVEGNEDGATFNLDGSTYTGGGLVVPAISFNTTQEELSKEAIEKFIEENQDKIGGSSIKVGLYKFKDSNQVSIDLNIVVKPEHRDIALAFGRFAGQESLFNLDNFENIPTGADGKNPKTFTSEEFRQISESLSVGEFPQFINMSPSNSSNYANLTEDGQGNFVFYHVGNNGYETIRRNSGATTATSSQEASALSKVGGVAMYYTRPEDGETMVSGSSKYMVKIPMSKVYDFNTDVLNLYDVAKEQHDKEHPGKGFDPNSQVAYITKIAGGLGYEMVVSQWKNITRAQSIKELSPVDTQILNGNVISKTFENSYDSNTTKGYKSVIPVPKEEKLKSLYLEINSERNAQNRYDSLYNLYADYYKKTQKEIADMIENSDISQGLKDKYKELLNEEEGSRMSIFNPPSTPVSTRQPSLEKDGVKIFAKERVNPATGEKLDGIEWELIESSDKGKGNARRAAELFLNGTDAQGKDVYLTVSPRDNDTKAGRLESFYSSLGFEKTSDFEMVRRAKKISLKDSDSNGEPSIKTLMDFSNSKVKPLGLEGLKAAKNAAMALKVKSSQELIEKMEKALMKNGIVLFDKLSLQRSKLYNTFEINTILSSPKLQKQIKESILALRNSEPFTIEYDENFIVPQGREVNQFGKQEVINPNISENEIMQSVAGLKESEIDEALPAAFTNKYYTDSDFRETVDSIARDYKKAPVKTIIDGELTDKVEDVEGMLTNTITDDANEAISEDIMFLREEIDEEIFNTNLEKVSKVLNKIKKNAYINGIDLRNFPTLALELSRAELLGFLDSMEDVIVDQDNQDELKEFSERYFKILGDKEAKTEVIKSNSENDVIVEEPLPEYEMFSKFGLVKKDDNIYRQVTEESLDTLYENFFEYKNLLPEGIETLEALKSYVQKNANQLEVSDYEVDVDNLEKMFLYKKFFDFPMSTQKARVKTDNFNKITNSEGYLTDVFMKEFNKWILATANPYFKVTGRGIELVNNDELSKVEAVNSVPEKFKQELAEYNIISDNLNLDMPLLEEKYEDINTQLEQRQKAVNNPDRVKKVSGQYTYLKDGVLAAKNESETFVKTPIGIFEKIFEFENIKFYGKLDTGKKQGYKKVNVEAPFSDINFKDYMYLANSPESFKTSKNYYSKNELNDINDEYFGCQ